MFLHGYDDRKWDDSSLAGEGCGLDLVADSYFMEMELILNDSYFTKANVDKSF